MTKIFPVKLTKEKFLELLSQTRRQLQNIKILEKVFESQEIINLIDKISTKNLLHFLMQYNIIYEVKGEGEEFWEKLVNDEIKLETIADEYWQGFMSESKK